MAPLPYYSDSRTTLHLGDSRNVLPTLPPDRVDLIVTDPPCMVEFKSDRGNHLANRVKCSAHLRLL